MGEKTHWTIRRTKSRLALVAAAAKALGRLPDDFTNVVDDALRIAGRSRIVLNGDFADTHIHSIAADRKRQDLE